MDSKTSKPSAKTPTMIKLKKRRKTPSDISTEAKQSHRRSITVDVSTKMMDKIKEEPDAATETKAESGRDEEPKMTLNKILIRTPAVGKENEETDNGSGQGRINRGDTDNARPEMLVRDKTFDRDVSFSVLSEISQATTHTRVNPRRHRRPKSCSKFTKEDLEVFLPRRSFFNAHDKLLQEAGHHVDTHTERKKPDWRSILKMHTMEELYPVKQEDVENDVPRFKDESESEDEMFSMEKTETLVSKEGHRSGRSKSSSKNAGNPEREKYKPLYEYLKYIHDNPEEYVGITKFTTKNLEHKHPNNLVRMGRVFRRGSNVRNSIYLHALSGLKPSVTEPVSGQDEADIVKLKGKVEFWLKGQTTQQYLKAKELALKDVGEEDLNYSKWWLAFKSCQYLRLPKNGVTDS